MPQRISIQTDQVGRGAGRGGTAQTSLHTIGPVGPIFEKATQDSGFEEKAATARGSARWGHFEL
jgi:hypothetical protein